jgi:hypothetical protein
MMPIPRAHVNAVLVVVFILSGIGFVIAGWIGGSYLHFLLAAVSMVSAAIYRSRNRERADNFTRLAGVAMGCAAAWIVGVLLLAFTYALLMRHFD